MSSHSNQLLFSVLGFFFWSVGWFVDNSHPGGVCGGISHCGSDLHSIMISDVKHLFMFISDTCIFFGKMCIQILW